MLVSFGYTMLELDTCNPAATRATAGAAVIAYALHTQRASLLRAAGNSRLAFAATLTLVMAVVYIWPSLGTLGFVCAIGVVYVACELHATGNLAS